MPEKIKKLFSLAAWSGRHSSISMTQMCFFLPFFKKKNNEGANISERLIESEGMGPAVAAAAPVSTRGRVQTERITSVPAVRLYLDSLGSLPIITGT